MLSLFLLQAEDGIRDLVRSRGLGDVYKRQVASVMPLMPAGCPTIAFVLAEGLTTMFVMVIFRNLSLIHI